MKRLLLASVSALFLAACGQPADQAPEEAAAPAPAADEAPPPVAEVTESPGAINRLYWGDTHLHTSYSPDAYLMQNRSADPDTAYRYAKGYPVVHPYHKARIQIGTPLDFLVVSDHGEFMGVIPMLFSGDERVASTET